MAEFFETAVDDAMGNVVEIRVDDGDYIIDLIATHDGQTVNVRLSIEEMLSLMATCPGAVSAALANDALDE